MSLIKFPSHIKPSRVTVQLMRVDETVASPLTNIQQVISRGNPAWKWTYEYTNLSESEREVVQAFLLNCRGSLNTFKVSDPADYQIRGSVSDWTDIFSGYGSFNVVAGSDTNKVNSWFGHSGNLVSHVTDDKTVLFEWRNSTSAKNLQWAGHGTVGQVHSFESGIAYLHRVKYFGHNNVHAVTLAVGSGSDSYLVQDAPATYVYSSGVISAPFIAHNNSYNLGVVDWFQSAEKIGGTFEFADYVLQRCALVVKSENLLTYSNSFGASDWTKTRADVVHNTLDDPLGGNHTWRLYVNSDENNDTHYLQRSSITKTNTQDIYTFGIYGRVGNGLDGIRIRFTDGVSDAFGDFDISVASVFNIDTDTVFKRAHGKIWDVKSGYYRAQFTALCSSHSTLNVQVYAINSQGGSTVFATTDTSYIEIVGASMVKFPFLKPYFETEASTIVGTGELTGSEVYMEGFDAEDVIKAGTRIEIVNQYHDDTNNLYERSEFKRITKETRASLDGHALVYFDPPIRNGPIAAINVAQQGEEETLHNAVLFHQPEMKARLLGGTIQYIDKPLKMTDVVFDVLEDLTE